MVIFDFINNNDKNIMSLIIPWDKNSIRYESSLLIISMYALLHLNEDICKLSKNEDIEEENINKALYMATVLANLSQQPLYANMRSCDMPYDTSLCTVDNLIYSTGIQPSSFNTFKQDYIKEKYGKDISPLFDLSLLDKSSLSTEFIKDNHFNTPLKHKCILAITDRELELIKHINNAMHVKIYIDRYIDAENLVNCSEYRFSEHVSNINKSSAPLLDIIHPYFNDKASLFNFDNIFSAYDFRNNVVIVKDNKDLSSNICVSFLY